MTMAIPVFDDRSLIDAVRQAVGAQTSVVVLLLDMSLNDRPRADVVVPRRAPRADEPHTVTQRWQSFVMKLVASEQDLKTNGAWARHVGVSRSMLCESCRLVHIAPHDARDFARMLRAIRRSGAEWKPEAVLDVSDVRTLKRLEARAGFTGTRHLRTPTVEEFLERQQWIPHENPALAGLVELLRDTIP